MVQAKISNKPCSNTFQNKPTILHHLLPTEWDLPQLPTTFRVWIACKLCRNLYLRIMIHWIMVVIEANNNSFSSSRDITKRSRKLNRWIIWWINLDQVQTLTSTNQITITRYCNQTIIITCFNRSSKYNQPTSDSKVIKSSNLKGLLISSKVITIWISVVASERDRQWWMVSCSKCKVQGTW